MPGSAQTHDSVEPLDPYYIDWKVWALWFLVFALLSAIMPRAAAFDVLHYHLTNGWSVLHGRLDRDMAPAGVHSFLNPTHSVFYWWLLERLPGPFVMALASPIQAAILPATYAFGARLTRRLDLTLPKSWLLASAMIGFLAIGNRYMVASVMNDHWGALLFITALAIVIGKNLEQAPLRSFFIASLLVGLAAGLKHTSIVYVAGFATYALILSDHWRSRIRAGLICFLGGFIGVILTGGWWSYLMWQMFENPIYPFMNSWFGSPPLGPDDAFRDLRMLPQTFSDALLNPIFFSIDTSRIGWQSATDYRFLFGYFATLIALPILAMSKAQTPQAKRNKRVVLAVSTCFLTTFVVWTASFSILRYALALWILAPVLTITLYAWGSSVCGRHYHSKGFLLAAACLCVFPSLSAPDHRKAWLSWSEPYTWSKIPEMISTDGAIIAFNAHEPSAFSASAFKNAAWLTHTNEPVGMRDGLENYRPLVKARIAASDAPIFVVVFPDYKTLSDELSRAAADLSMNYDVELCERIQTSFDTEFKRWFICPLQRPATPD